MKIILEIKEKAGGHFLYKVRRKSFDTILENFKNWGGLKQMYVRMSM